MASNRQSTFLSESVEVDTGVSSACCGHLMQRPVSKNHVIEPGSSLQNRFVPVEREIDGYSEIAPSGQT